MSKTRYGGQAVIEGVMMRGKDDIAIAVRKTPDDIILKKLKVASPGTKYPFLNWPFIRGIVSLISSMVIGIKSLTFSASQFAEEEEEEISSLEMVGVILLAFGFAILLFVVLPALIISLLQSYIKSNLILNFTEGIIKIITFLTYLYIISRMEDIKRVFMYHGAEHKTIFTYEAGLPLTVENARGFSTLHPRCGTNFMFLVILISIFFFSFLGRPPFLQRVLYHLLLLPIIAGTSYEVLRLAGKDKVNPFIKIIATPGLYLQKLTTREPDDSMLEVALAALKAVLPEGEVDEIV